MPKRSWRTIASLPAPACFQRLRHPLGLQAVEAAGEAGALFRRAQQPLAAVATARLLRDPAFVDELLQHAGQALLGDLQDLQQVRDPQARIAVDEVQHAVVGAAQAEFGQHGVGLAREVAVGEKQQLDDGDEAGVGAGSDACPRFRRLAARYAAQRLGIYVSHVDLFDPDC